MPGTTSKHKESQGIWVGSQRSCSSQTGGLLGSPLRAAGSASWEPCFSHGMQGFQEAVSFSMDHERQSWVHIIPTPGTIRKHRNPKVFGGIPVQFLIAGLKPPWTALARCRLCKPETFISQPFCRFLGNRKSSGVSFFWPAPRA